ncbi:hypothetical protein BC940DRAFT_297207 [Gongronella butleri]|nr:hypothetical protein BC940DRAFT_297207 [Gongronella butleri]
MPCFCPLFSFSFFFFSFFYLIFFFTNISSSMKLPSIHSLLNPPPSPPTPVVQVMPASPTPGFQAERDPPQTSSQWPSPMLSPALSSSRSPSVCSMGPPSPIMTQQSSELPPIHGDDPPRPLSRSPMMHPKPYLHSDKLLHRHQHASHRPSSLSPPQPAHYGSNSSISPLLSPQSHPQHNYHQRHRSWSASNAYEECQRRPPPTNSPHLQLPPSALPLSSFSSSSPRHLAVPGADTPSMPSLQRRSSYSAPLAPARRAAGGVKKVSKPNAKPAALSIRKESAPAPPPCTEILISPTTGQPILKRRRGRPPTRSPGYDEGGWTFLSPTVWNVTTTANPSIPPSSLASTNTSSSSASDDDDDGHMTDAMTAFTGADMDTVLPMPKKKRGRKPKTHIEGNSCFVWKDITASKRAKSC